jgi:hypothetical protein
MHNASCYQSLKKGNGKLKEKRKFLKGRPCFFLLFLFALFGKLKNPYFSFLHSSENWKILITGHDYRRTFLHCILPVNVYMLLCNLYNTKRPIKVMLWRVNKC